VELVGVWRYPVKSMQGEALDAVQLVASGLAGDRRYAVQVHDSGLVLSAKREGRLLMARAATDDPLRISLPSGETLLDLGPATDCALSSWLGRRVRLIEADCESVPTFESQIDEADDASPSVTWQGRPGAFVDSTPVHLLTTASLRAFRAERPDLDWNVARFRPNLLVEADSDERVEDAWVGRRCRIGDAQLEIIKRCTRCVMVTRTQPGGIERQLDVLRHLSLVAESKIGVLARVTEAARVSVGDRLTLQ
jgi:uncharacterized protein YcbX